MEIRTIAIVGANDTGRSVAYFAALAGYRTILEDISPSALEQGIAWIALRLDEEFALGKIDAGTRDAALANLKEITAKVNDGEGTIGALIADPTVYERLVAILDGAQRSFLLRGLLRNLGSGKAREGE